MREKLKHNSIEFTQHSKEIDSEIAESLIVKMLNEEEVVTSIKDKMPDFAICVSDLKAPTAKFVQSYYVRVLEELGVDVDMLKEALPEQVRELDYPDAYRHAQHLTNVYFALSSVFERIYVDDFSVLDITEPSPRRTLYLMKAMDMFHTFADWKAQNVQNSITKLVHHKADYDQLRAECEKLKSEVNMRASERAQREVRKRELIAMIEERKNKILQLKKEDTEVQESTALYKAGFMKAKQKEELVQAEDQKLEAEALKLQSQIVESPDQLQADLNHLLEGKEKSEIDKQQLAEVKQEKSRQKDLYKKFVRMQEEYEVKQKVILALNERIKEVEKKKEETQKNKQASTTKEQEMNRKFHNFQKKIAQLQEQKMAVSMQRENMKAALTQNIEEKEREKMLLTKKVHDVHSKVAEVRAERKEVEETFSFLKERSEAQNKAFDNLYETKTSEQDANIKKIQDAQTKLIECLRKHK